MTTSKTASSHSPLSQSSRLNGFNFAMETCRTLPLALIKGRYFQVLSNTLFSSATPFEEGMMEGYERYLAWEERNRQRRLKEEIKKEVPIWTAEISPTEKWT